MRRPAVIAILLLVALSLALHGSALRGWWLYDDPQVLLHAKRNSPAETLLDAGKWRYLSSANFTPLVTLSFDLDLALAGIEPKLFYAHQWVALTLAAILLFLLLQRAAGALPALLAAAIFLASPLSTLAARTLMVRHYLEGLVFALLALLAWTSDRERRFAWDALAAAAYLVAMLAKETYAPLPLLMIFAARAEGESWGRIAKRLAAPAVAAIAYLVWRAAILGSPGGYGAAPSWRDIATLPVAVWKRAIGPMPVAAAIVVAIAVLLLIGANAKRPRAFFGFLLAAGAFAFLPLALVATIFEWRHALVAFVVATGGAALAMRERPRALAAVALGVPLAAFALAGIEQRRSYDAFNRAMVAEGKYVWERPKSAPPLLAQSVGWYLGGLDDLRESPSPRYLLSTDALVLGAAPAESVVAIDDRGRVTKPAREILASVAAERSRFDPSIPISVRIERRGNDFAWTFAPPEGEWRFLSYPLYDEIVLPAKGWQRLPQPDAPQQFRVRRKLADGRWNATPVATLPVRDGAVVVRSHP